MNYSTAIMLINDQVKAVKVQYEPNGTSTIFKSLIPDLRVDDLVIVPTSTRYQFTIAKVVEPDVDIDFDMETQIGWLAGRFDPTGYIDTLVKEEKAIAIIKTAETRDKRTQLRDKLLKVSEEELKSLPIYSHQDK